MRPRPVLLISLAAAAGCPSPDPLCGDAPIERLFARSAYGPEVATTVSVAAGDTLGEVVPVGDLDGDGTDDLVIELGAERLGLFRGADLAAGRVSSTADAWRSVDAGVGAAARAGDIDGDGLAELLVGAPDGWLLIPGATVAAGEGPIRRTDAARTLIGAEGRTIWGAVGGGDVDGDGLDDVLVADRGVYNKDRDLEDVRLYPGADLASPGETDPLAYKSSYRSVVDGESHYSMTLFGDYDGDGLADLATGAVRNFGAVTSAEVLLERKEKALSGNEIHLHDCHPDGCPDSVQVREAGDVDGDRSSDLILVGSPSGGTWLIPGVDLADKDYKSTWTGGAHPHRVRLIGAGSAVGVGDLDGDGRAEVLASDGATAWLLVGPHAACEAEVGDGVEVTTANHRFEGFAAADLEVVAPGDLDGDGVPDLLLVDPAGALHFVLVGGLEGAR